MVCGRKAGYGFELPFQHFCFVLRLSGLVTRGSRPPRYSFQSKLPVYHRRLSDLVKHPKKFLAEGPTGGSHGLLCSNRSNSFSRSNRSIGYRRFKVPGFHVICSERRTATSTFREFSKRGNKLAAPVRGAFFLDQKADLPLLGLRRRHQLADSFKQRSDIAIMARDFPL